MMSLLVFLLVVEIQTSSSFCPFSVVGATVGYDVNLLDQQKDLVYNH